MTSTELYDDPGEKAIAIIPKFTSSLSLIGSLWIIVDIARQRTKWKRTYERLVLGMSLGDVVYSFGTFLSTWPIPVGSPFVWAAMGNTQTCEAQGFIIQFGGIFELYNAFLAVYYLLTLKYRLKRHQILNFEKAAHIFVLSVSTITSFAGLFLNLYNNADVVCWIAPFPLECSGGEVPCERGQNAFMYRLFFRFVWVWMIQIVLIVGFGMIYNTTRQQTIRMSRYAGGSEQAKQNQRATATLAFLYIASFFSTNIIGTAVRIYQTVSVSENYKTPSWMMITLVTLRPLQGFWNSIIYFRPRFLRYRKRHQDLNACGIINRLLIQSVGLRTNGKRETPQTAELELPEKPPEWPIESGSPTRQPEDSPVTNFEIVD